MFSFLLSFLPDLLRDVGKERKSIIDPDESIENLFLQVGSQFLETTRTFAVQRDLVAGIMVSEDKPIITKGRGVVGWRKN